MAVNRITKLLLISIAFVVNANAVHIGDIGFISPNYPSYKKLHATRMEREDIEDFFEEFMDEAYYSYSKAGLAVVNNLNIPRGDVIYKDVKYNNVLMIPSDENREAIEEFYKNKSLQFLKNTAKENHVDILLYSKFRKRTLNKIFKHRKSISKIGYTVFAYDSQSSARNFNNMTIDIKDLFDSPDYDPDQLQSLFIKNYIELLKDILGSLQRVGGQYSNSSSSSSSSSSSNSSSSTQNNDTKNDSSESMPAAEENDSGENW